MPPRLSIVIPSHRRADLLEECLASVQCFAPSGTEILVVDDASPRGEISALAARLPGVGCLRLPRQRGFCAAVNAGIAHTSGAVVELLNDDTLVCRGWAEAALEALADPAVGAVAPLVLCWPGSPTDPCPRVDSAGDRYYLGGVAGKRGHRQRLSPTLLQRGLVFGASGSSAFFRRDALVRVGGFPEEFGAYFEDVDLAFRLHRAGYQVVYEPASRVWHHVSASHGRPRGPLLAQQSQNEERVFWRNLPVAALPQALPRHAAVLAGKFWRRWDEGTLAPFLTGRLRILGEIPALVRHRRWLRGLGPNEPLHSWQVESTYLPASAA